MMDEYINYMVELGVDQIPHTDSTGLDGDLLSHSLRVAGMLCSYGRSDDEVRAGLFHSVYGNEFQMYKVDVDRDDLCDLIGNYPEYLVAKFNSLEDRPYTILYGKGLKDPEKTALRWLEYCNIRDQDPEADILKEFELVLKVNEDVESEMQTM
tara:strand:- start:3701 stop:4159 length:459 start_codon:yes stop_codon:yes gene_type:complete